MNDTHAAKAGTHFSLALVFFFLTGAGLVICLLDLLSSSGYRAFPRPDQAYPVLAGAELFFFLVLFPLWFWDATKLTGREVTVGVVLLFLLSAPLALIATRFSAVPWPGVAFSQLLLLAAAAAAGGCVLLDRATSGRVRQIYYVVVFALAAALPLLRLLLGRVFRITIPWLTALSPFEALGAATAGRLREAVPTVILLVAIALATIALSSRGRSATEGE